MRPIELAELSALLDGELPPSRAEEVRLALATDATLKKAYDRLAMCDVAWKTQAATTMFQPQVKFHHQPVYIQYMTAAAVALGLVILRMGLKAMPLPYGVGLAALLLALMIIWGLGRIMLAANADLTRFTLAVGGY